MDIHSTEVYPIANLKKSTIILHINSSDLVKALNILANLNINFNVKVDRKDSIVIKVKIEVKNEYVDLVLDSLN